MEPMNEVYVVLSGKDLVYVTLNKSDAEGLEYRLTEAGVMAHVDTALMMSKEKYAELARSTPDAFSEHNRRSREGYIKQLLGAVDSLRKERDKANNELLARDELVASLRRQLCDAQRQERDLREEVAVLVEEADKSLAECLESLKKK